MALLVSIFSHFNEVFTDMVMESVWITRSIGLLGICLFILVEIGIAIASFFTGNGESFPNFQRALSYIVLFFFLSAYRPVMETFDGIINTIEAYLREQGDTDYASLAADLIVLKHVEMAPTFKKAEEGSSTLQDLQNGINTSWEQVKATYRDTLKFFSISLPALFFASIADGLTAVIRYVVEILSVLLTGVLLILGPFAAMFQTAPWIGEGILKNWFSTWLSVKCWTITMAVIDMMMHKFLILFKAQSPEITEYFSAEFMTSGVWIQVVNLSFICLFILTPLITSYYVKGGGGAFFTKVIGAATTLVHAAGAAATMGGSAAAQQFAKNTMGSISEKLAEINSSLNKQNKSK